MYRIFQGERILQDSLFARAHREKKLASEEARKFFYLREPRPQKSYISE